jgi:hypothetical protein
METVHGHRKETPVGVSIPGGGVERGGERESEREREASLELGVF